MQHKTEETVIIFETFRKTGTLPEVISVELLADSHFVSKILKYTYDILKYLDAKQLRHPKIIKEVSKSHSNYLKYYDFLAGYKEFVLEAVSNYGFNLEYVKETSDTEGDLKDDIDVVLAAVKNEGLALEFASERLKDNCAVVVAALRV